MNSIDLPRILHDAGLQDIRVAGKEIWALCPMHVARTGKPDMHPSWSINQNTFAHHCFSCGYSGRSLPRLLSDITGRPVSDDLEHILRQQGVQRAWEQTRAEPASVLDVIVPRLTEFALINILRDVPERFLKRRWLRRAAIDAYGVRYDREYKQVVMPLRSPEGTLLGAQYRTHSSVLTQPKGLPKASTLFGYTLICKHGFCALVESPLDAVRLFGLGIPAVAALGAWVSAEQIRLLSRAFSTVYVALDNPAIDKAGREGTAAVVRGLHSRHTAAVPWNYKGLVDEDGRKAKDVGDVPDDGALVDSWERTKRLGL